MIRKIIAYLKNNKKQTCHFHEYYISETSNILQLDEMGYPLMLCIKKCANCEKTKQVWIDVDKKLLNNDKYKILEWRK